MNTLNKERRAVAPIIATLLMVAISVVGGILIFVFAQGFFNNTSIQGPSIESLTFTGYDFRDVAVNNIQDHSGVPITGVGAATPANNIFVTGDQVAVYVKNTGAQQILINKVQVQGLTYTFVTAAAAGSYEVETSNAGSPALGNTAAVAGAATLSTTPSLKSGQEATLIIDFGGTGYQDIKVGKNVLVAVTTSNGAAYTLNVIAGISNP